MPDLLELMRQYLGPVVEGQMGQAQAQNENPFLMFPNRGFFGDHPNFTNRLESGLPVYQMDGTSAASTSVSPPVASVAFVSSVIAAVLHT